MRAKPVSPAACVERDSDGAPDAYYSLKRLTSYSGIGLRTLRGYLTHAAHPLPHYKVGGKILVKRSEFDTWIMTFRRDVVSRVDVLVNELIDAR